MINDDFWVRVFLALIFGIFVGYYTASISYYRLILVLGILSFVWAYYSKRSPYRGSKRAVIYFMVLIGLGPGLYLRKTVPVEELGYLEGYIIYFALVIFIVSLAIMNRRKQ
jgi:hypothetical protein